MLFSDSQYRDVISMSILELQENGVIQMLYNKWWRNSGTCNDDKSQESKANSLGVANVGGIFVVLFVGLTFAIFVAFVEFLVNSKKNSGNDRVSILQFLNKCWLISRIILQNEIDNIICKLVLLITVAVRMGRNDGRTSLCRPLSWINKEACIKTSMFSMFASLKWSMRSR